LPDDLEGRGDDFYDMAEDSEGNDDLEEGEEEVEEVEESEDVEDEVFALAREHEEMKFANQDMVEKIEKMEDEMMD
jgi:hypothetical protein